MIWCRWVDVYCVHEKSYMGKHTLVAFMPFFEIETAATCSFLTYQHGVESVTSFAVIQIEGVFLVVTYPSKMSLWV